MTPSLDVPVEGGLAYTYVCRPEYCKKEIASTHAGAIRASYVEIVESGLTKLGGAFQAAYYQSTDAVPQSLVIDDKVEVTSA